MRTHRVAWSIIVLLLLLGSSSFGDAMAMTLRRPDATSEAVATAFARDADPPSTAPGPAPDVEAPGASPLSTAGCSTALQTLVDNAEPDSVINVPACIYRETVTVTKSITLDGQRGAEIRGSDVWDSGWDRDGEYWTRGGLPSFSTSGTCSSDSSQCLWPEQVFVDEEPLLQVASHPLSGQFAVDAARQVVLADDPNRHIVEVAVRTTWIAIEGEGVVIQGFRMKHAANSAQNGALRATANGWSVSNNVLSDTHGAVVTLSGSGGKLIGNDIFRGGQLGVHGSPDNALIQANLIHDNNTEGFDPFWEAGGLKIVYADGTVMDSNEVFNNDGPGLWCDISCNRVTISNNRVHHNARNGGIHYELSFYGSIYGNIVWENNWSYKVSGIGAGILIANSNNTEVFNNIVAWNADGIAVINGDRGQQYNDIQNNTVHHNTIVSTVGSDQTALGWFVHEGGSGFAPVLCNDGYNNQGVNNAYWFDMPEPTSDRFNWCGGFSTIDSFNATLGEEEGRYLSLAERDQVLTTAGIPLVPEPQGW